MNREERGQVAVVGAGVIGLTTAIRLREAGFEVTILARETPPDTNSDVAGAVWLPYRVGPPARVLPWARSSFAEYERLSRLEVSGVFLAPLVELFRDETPEPWWRAGVREFARLAPGEAPPGYRDGFRVRVPVVEPGIYLPYLMERFESSGGTLRKEEVTDLEGLFNDFPLVVNCTGVEAARFVSDLGVYPIRGQVVRVARPPGLDPTVWVYDEGATNIFIVPRRADCLLGGTAEEGEWDRTPDPATGRAIVARCAELVPALAGAKVYEHRVGLRPGRREVRLEPGFVVGKGSLIHNYGHGGAGFTLSWGCAEEVTLLAAGESA